MLITTVECWQTVMTMITHSNQVASAIMGIMTAQTINFSAFVDIIVHVIVKRQHHIQVTHIGDCQQTRTDVPL